MGYSRQEYWSGLPFSPPEDLPDPEIEPTFSVSPALAGRFFTTEPPSHYHHFSALQLRVQLTLSIHSYLLFSDPRTVAHTLNSIQPYLFSLGQITTAFFFLLLQSMSFISLQSGNTSLIPSPFPLHLFEVCFQKNRS